VKGLERPGQEGGERLKEHRKKPRAGKEGGQTRLEREDKGKANRFHSKSAADPGRNGKKRAERFGQGD